LRANFSNCLKSNARWLLTCSTHRTIIIGIFSILTTEISRFSRITGSMGLTYISSVVCCHSYSYLTCGKMSGKAALYFQTRFTCGTTPLKQRPNLIREGQATPAPQLNADGLLCVNAKVAFGSSAELVKRPLSRSEKLMLSAAQCRSKKQRQ
jgi:hypothetical protein